MLIFTSEITERLRFAANEIALRCGIKEIKFTTDSSFFSSESSSIKINYSNETIPNSIRIIPHGLLFESDIHNQKIEWFSFENIPVFFKTNHGDLPFDIFSFVFFHLSRYEEYLPHHRDIHDRFSADQSILFHQKTLEKPIVDFACKEFAKLIQSRFPQINFTPSKFTAQFTFDIDQAWAYLNKSAWRKAGGMLKDVLKFNWVDLKERIKVYRKQRLDPYDSFGYLEQVIKENQLDSIFFFHLGDRSAFDKSINWKNKNFQQLINHVKAFSSIGIHPSYYTYIDKNSIKNEIDRYKNITSDTCTLSRQHYLRFSLPDTYQFLTDLGIQEEFSMGFADRPGFRAATCFPFLFFNLKTNTISELKIIPLTVMDGTLHQYLGLTPEQATQKSKELIEAVKSVNGNLVCLWHNDSLNEQGSWKNWRKVFEHQILLAKN